MLVDESIFVKGSDRWVGNLVGKFVLILVCEREFCSAGEGPYNCDTVVVDVSLAVEELLELSVLWRVGPAKRDNCESDGTA